MTVLTLRLIKSFEYRSIKSLVLRDVDLSMTLKDFIEYIKQGKLKEIECITYIILAIINQSAFKWSSNAIFDTLKLYTQPFGAKSQNLAINFDNDEELILISPKHQELLSRTLNSLGCKNETELSYFNYDQYINYKNDPKILW